LQFAGLIMGDHSKTAINTQLNTGTVVELLPIFSKKVFLRIWLKVFRGAVLKAMRNLN
jgi:hypothetical protein